MRNDAPLPVNTSQTINPYLASGADLARRLLWDLRPVSWISRARLKGWRDRFADEAAVIVCNGPSLRETDFDLLSEVFTIGLNKINLLFGDVAWRPSVIAAVNAFVMEQNREFYNRTDIPLFLGQAGVGQIAARRNVAFLHESSHRRFARDCSLSVYVGHTVTYVAMQLAFHMGFRRIALIGCDHNFATAGPANQTVEAGASDPNHFHPDYFSGGVKWQLPDLFQSEISYRMAGQVFAAAGGEIVNCTQGGKLEIFPRASLAEFLA